ncbi:hypothetical protein [Pelagicoccus albus]|uniref:3-keto-disaccharide hydrolase domain-containing protein n=1 Tax=Pelagicoccus albus TaxID=415222 RepID=A0A7X1B655_9BACT|nr:hypothetical protein [Pelagicoccus albus]MBC2605100.1 hypothetical protein [Pelagicoccus albus]
MNTFLALFCTLMMVLPGEAKSDGEFGSLTNVISVGESGAWSGTWDAGSYWMRNASDAGAIRYFFSNESNDFGARRISVEVNVDDAPADGRAGLLYAYHDSPKVYYMLLVGNDGMFEIYKRDEGGVRMMTGSSFDFSESGYQRIEIREKGKEVSFYVNGRNLGSIESDATGSGAVGIVAMNLGNFGFRGYED